MGTISDVSVRQFEAPPADAGGSDRTTEEALLSKLSSGTQTSRRPPKGDSVALHRDCRHQIIRELLEQLVGRAQVDVLAGTGVGAAIAAESEDARPLRLEQHFVKRGRAVPLVRRFGADEYLPGFDVDLERPQRFHQVSDASTQVLRPLFEDVGRGAVERGDSHTKFAAGATQRIGGGDVDGQVDPVWP